MKKGLIILIVVVIVVVIIIVVSRGKDEAPAAAPGRPPAARVEGAPEEAARPDEHELEIHPEDVAGMEEGRRRGEEAKRKAAEAREAAGVR